MEKKHSEKKNINILKWINIILGVVLIIAVTSILTKYFLIKELFSQSGISYLTAKLSVVNEKIEANYLGDVDENKMYEYAIKGYVAGLGDKYAEYYTVDEMKAEQKENSGKFSGIGIYMTINSEGKITIVGIYEDSGAEEAGLQEGDIIIGANGVKYDLSNYEEFSNVLKGEDGTSVNIQVLRENQELNIEVVRKTINIKSVKSKMIDNIGYMRIVTFNENTAEEFEIEYKNLKNQNCKGLIIDLRSNGGGIVSEAIKVADYIVDKGNCLMITSNRQNKEHKEIAKKNPIVDIPVVCIVNESTASASEILTASLRENNRCKVVGKKSYGKGVIQAVYLLSDGSGLKFTTEEYFSPNHNKINKVGITPDIDISLSEESKKMKEIPIENDEQLQEAIKQLK